MVTVPVLWLSLNPDAIPRGYWDHGCLEDLFAGDLYPLPDLPTFEHHTLDTLAHDWDSLLARVRHGGVLIVPARHHVEARYIYGLKALLAEMPWSLLILTGDEGGEMHSEWFTDMPRSRLWVMTPQGEREYGNTYPIGSGYPPGIRTILAEREGERRLAWAFLGQITHDRREQCIKMLRARSDDGCLVESGGFTQGIDQDDYWRTLADAKVAPCPSGPLSADSFRVYEALEAGCVPIADDRHPGPAPQLDYWERLFGSPPFPTVKGKWRDESATLDAALAHWPASGNRVFSWWQRQKRAMTLRLVSDLTELGATDNVVPSVPAECVTAIIVTSPTPRQPDLADLETTVQSIREQLGGCEIVLVFDGIRPEAEHRRTAYEEYTRRALWAANTRWGPVVPLVLDEWQHQARASRTALDWVRTRHVLMVEHDTPLTGEVDWPAIVETLDLCHVDMIRLHHETTIGDPHWHMMLDKAPTLDCGPAPIIRTWQWSQRPHVAPTSWYERLLDRYFASGARTMIEDVMHGVVASDHLDGGTEFRLAVYAPDGENWQRSLHLDSRRLIVGEEETGDSKGTMRFAYPGETPAGAPAPGWR